jgi:hypothetical protein
MAWNDCPDWIGTDVRNGTESTGWSGATHEKMPQGFLERITGFGKGTEMARKRKNMRQIT